MATLQEIAKTYENLAKATAPVKTGAMRDRIKVSYAKLDDLTYQFDLNGISYMVWWNTPPKIVSKRRRTLSKRSEFNFVVRASNNPILKDKIDEYIKADIITTVTDNMRYYLEKDGFGKVKQVFRKIS
jgi:hypothetical protein